MYNQPTAARPVFCLKRAGKQIRHTFCTFAALLGVTILTGQANAQVPDLGIGASLHGKPIFPAGDAWNQDISQLPVDPNSDTLISSIGLTKNLHPDFGTFWNGAPNGFSYIVVPGTQTPVPITFTYAGESDPGPYPIPSNAPIEGGSNSTGDRHVLVIDRDNWILYETFNSWPQADGSWKASSGAIFDLTLNTIRPQGWTSADAAGLPIFPGLVRYDEVMEQGVINHALRFTVSHTRRAYTFPARHLASSLTGSSYAPMGMRVRLKANYDISGFPAAAQVILTALKKYGMFVADNGSDWFLSGATDSRWDDNALATLKNVPGSAFEVVQMGDIITDTVAPPINLRAAPGNASVTLTWNASAGAASYNIKQALTPIGPFPTVANVTGTTATVGGLTNGTAYYFVVTTVNTTGQSVNSIVVPATPNGSGQSVTLTAVSVNSGSATGGASVQGTVTLSAAAPAGGVNVSLRSSNTAAASVPPSVLVPAGATSANFTIQTFPVTALTTVTLTATVGGVSKTASLQVQPGQVQLSSISASPTGTKGGGSLTGTVTLQSAAGSGGAVVTLHSGNSVVGVPASVTVPAGATSATFTITTSAVTAKTYVTISGTLGVTKTVTLTISP